ncbi:protein-disulfide reductase DsbD family protein [Litoreibacter janthinus]|uniref:Suppressor for copper-sensitivity B n=1 Tax=Litoreibacter janthinus TaxID=670154 RepID=A0A1I6GW50_9RHOB|nr:protein-disulfide reductase DsbD domain-containing protein [Litoreibacter janthinus]SFR46418.1 suppressor for copper-sensitivity B [Litoreibacter janthinus]
MRFLASLLVIWLSVASTPAFAASSLAYQSDRMTARLITAENGVTPEAGTLSAALQIQLADGWKTYWQAPGAVGYPPELNWDASSNIASTELLFPAPTRFEAFDIENYGYAKEVTFPIRVDLDQAGGATVLNVSANVLVCAELCIPEMFNLSVTLLGGTGGIDGAAAAMIADAAAKVPGALADAGLRDAQHWIATDQSELQVAVASDTRFGQDLQIFANMGSDAAFGAPTFSFGDDRKSLVASLPVLSFPASSEIFEITLTDGKRAATFQPGTLSDTAFTTSGGATALWSIALIALLGGLILNIMPCVLPVLAVKFASALKSSDQSAARIRAGFVVSALGVLVFMWSLAGVLLAIRTGGGQVGWGVQFQNPVFLGLMITLIAVFAANMAGLFEITLPQKLNTSIARMEHGSGLLGDFATGALAAVLATPCSAPFLGTAVTFALAGSGFEAMVIFTALGVGLAAPYLAVALRPSLVQALPKPGQWMIRVKWVMAALLAVTALWLGSVLLTVAGWAVVSGVFGFVVAAIVALQIGGKGVLRFAPITLVLAAILVPVALRPVPQAIVNAANWAVFDERAIAAAVADGEVVFVDVTAAWCLTCKANKASVLDRDPVAGLLSSDGVTAMRADWTQQNPDILAFLQRNGRFGIPFNIVYGPDAPSGIMLPEFLTKDAVLNALGAARL